MNDFYKINGKLPHEYYCEDINWQDEKHQLIYDLIDIFCTIYIMDISIKRTGNIPRVVTPLRVPVSDFQLWNSTKELIEELINFTSDDLVKIEFISQNKFKSSQQLHLNIESSAKAISLLSGGLDSFGGAFNNYQSKKKVIYAGYKINHFEQNRQENIASFLKYYLKSSPIKLFSKIDLKKIEPSQKTRSLLFLSFATSVAFSNSIRDIYIYENGILSLNPEIFGRSTTKTTHPKTIYLFNKLLENVKLNVNIKNPFLFKTKGEIIGLLDEPFKMQIKNTHTCGRSRQDPRIDGRQCGYCVPCILRKISITSNDLEAYDDVYLVGYGIKINQIDDDYIIHEYKSSVEYFRQYKKLIDNDEIYSYMEISRKYYEENDYLSKTEKMLRLFSKEFERFWEKNEIY